MKIEPLSEGRLKEAIQFVNSIFDELHPDDLDHPNKLLPASLHPEREESKKIFAKSGDIETQYFLIIDNDKVVGITGYYTLIEDMDEADWLAWLAVDPEYRRQGVGTRLINFIRDNAKKRGKKFLRLYTNPEEDIEAISFYDRLNFQETKKEMSPYRNNILMTFRELKI